MSTSESGLGCFLERLEHHLLDERFEASPPPPMVVQQLVGYYAECGHLRRLERLLCRLPVACLDLHQVNKRNSCWSGQVVKS